MALLFSLFIFSLLSYCCGDDASMAETSAFEDNFQVMWADDHVQKSEGGLVWHLLLDQNSGSGFQSKSCYKYGWFSMKLKLVAGDSAGVVTAYYMSSNTENRDELDFEFLGNRSGEPYIVQSNVYVNGVGQREQRIYLWFDPTEDFHTYSVLWNHGQVVFYVDQVPIRVHQNTPKTTFPSQPMYVFSSIWNADQWATRGGLEKINWGGAPFVSSYEKFHAFACKGSDEACLSNTSSFWWDQSNAWTLDQTQQAKYNWVTQKLLVYNYCIDKLRYPIAPPECSITF